MGEERYGGGQTGTGAAAGRIVSTDEQFDPRMKETSAALQAEGFRPHSEEKLPDGTLIYCWINEQNNNELRFVSLAKGGTIVLYMPIAEGNVGRKTQ